MTETSRIIVIQADPEGRATLLGMETTDQPGEVVDAELRRREDLIVGKKLCRDIFDYREQRRNHPGEPDWPAICDLTVVVVDPDSSLLKSGEYLKLLGRVGRTGRSLGVGARYCTASDHAPAPIGGLIEHLSLQLKPAAK